MVVGKVLRRHSRPMQHSMQIEDTVHIHLDAPFASIKHSCDPNCVVRLNLRGALDLVALRAIGCDEEIVFDYAMTEWECTDFGECCCAARSCRGSELGVCPVTRTALIK